MIRMVDIIDMKKTITWRIFVGYMLILFFMLLASSLSAQITVTQFNASWNASNDVEWCDDLTDCDLAYVDISKEPSIQKEHNVVVVPTIIIFNDGEEIKRFQADLSFKMLATRKEIQGVIDEQLMSDF